MAHQSNSNAEKTKYEISEPCLDNILLLIKPSEEDRLERQRIIGQVASISGSVESLKGCNVVPFGSFVSNLYTQWGDLDVSLELSSSPSKSTSTKLKRKLLQSIQIAIQKSGFGHGFESIPRVNPVLAFKCCNQNIACNICINNHGCYIKSKMLLWITQMDGRIRDLIVLVKQWAKAYVINNAKRKILNSYSLSLLVIFHLQTCDPPVLPPLKTLYKGNVASETDPESFFHVPERYIEQKCATAIANFKTTNTSCISELLTSFFEKYTYIDCKASQYVFCTYSGQLESNKSKREWMTHKLMIEDPFDQRENTSRAVDEKELNSISDAFTSAYVIMSSYGYLSESGALSRFLVGRELSKSLPMLPLPYDMTNVNFTDEDLANIAVPCNDQIVFSATIGNFHVDRILLSYGSAANIISQEAFKKMDIGTQDLHPFRWVLFNSQEETINVLGRIILPLTLGEPPKDLTQMVDFLVMKGDVPFNVILGAPFLGLLRCKISLSHHMLKFATPGGIGYVQGNQEMLRSCLGAFGAFNALTKIVKT